MQEQKKQEEKKVNNVCFHLCHAKGRAGCNSCLSFHRGKEKPATHENDKVNPNW